jgi:hypothetical protein
MNNSESFMHRPMMRNPVVNINRFDSPMQCQTFPCSLFPTTASAIGIASSMGKIVNQKTQEQFDSVVFNGLNLSLFL